MAQLTPSAAIAAGLLPSFHGDPGDRLIYPTARELGVALVPRGGRIREYAHRTGGVEVIMFSTIGGDVEEITCAVCDPRAIGSLTTAAVTTRFAAG